MYKKERGNSLDKNINLSNLKRLMEENKNTEFGRNHHFCHIADFDSYRKLVPLSDYEEYRHDIERMMEGEKDILIHYPIYGISKTSGTTSKPKYIPLSERQAESIATKSLAYQDKVAKEVGGKRAFVNCFHVDVEQKNKEPCLFSEMFIQAVWKYTDHGFDEFVGGEKGVFYRQSVDDMYVKAWLCLAEENITIFEAIYMYDILLLFRYIEDKWKEIVVDMREKNIPQTRKINEEVRELLLSHCPSQERLNQICDECSKGFRNIVKRLWKNIRLVSGISSPSFFAEDKALDYYAKGISRYYYGLLASESFIGLATEENSFVYSLLKDVAVFEFLPVDAEETVLPEEVVLGEEYEVVVSNFGGLYRYKLGDIIKCVRNDESGFFFEYVRRKNQQLNVAGEKITLSVLEEAIEELRTQEIKLDQYVFSFIKDEMPVRYVLFAQSFERSKNELAESVSRSLDDILKKKNVVYEELRNMKGIGDLVCVILDEKKFQKFRKVYNLIAGHGKPKHLLLTGVEKRIINELQ